MNQKSVGLLQGLYPPPVEKLKELEQLICRKKDFTV
jgi:hypothetical protein